MLSSKHVLQMIERLRNSVKHLRARHAKDELGPEQRFQRTGGAPTGDNCRWSKAAHCGTKHLAVPVGIVAASS